MTTTDDPLVSTEWLAAHLGDPNVKIIDAQFKMPGILPLPKDDYLNAHIPGAVFFDVDAVSDHSNPLPHMFPNAEQFGRDVGGARHRQRRYGRDLRCRRLGRSPPGVVDVPVVRASERAHSEWRPEEMARRGPQGRERTRSRRSPPRSRPPSIRAYTRSMQQMVANLENRAEQVLDARANDRYQGKVAEPRPGLRSGHIPGSLSVPYNQLFDAATGAMKPLDDLRAVFVGAGVKLDAPIVTSCGSGVSALVLTLALYRLGVRGTGLYDGSWSEWGMPDGPPVATGPA